MQKYKILEQFLDNLDPIERNQVETLRKLILNSEPNLEESIKWNAPSYALNSEDRITFNLMNKQGVVKLVLHMGAIQKEDKKASPVLKNDSGLIEWSSDIRGVITFNSLDEINSNLTVLKTIITNWLAIAPKS